MKSLFFFVKKTNEGTVLFITCLVSEKYQRILIEKNMTISLLSCDNVNMETSNFTKPQLKKHINYQSANGGRGSSHKIENRPNFFSNEVS